MENFVDKEYKIHLTVAKAGLLYLLQLADTPLLPFTMERYSSILSRGIDSLAFSLEKVYRVDDDEVEKRTYTTNLTLWIRCYFRKA